MCTYNKNIVGILVIFDNRSQNKSPVYAQMQW